MRKKEILYHYTSGLHIASIMEIGIHVSSVGVFPEERPAVWLTTQPRMEATAVKMSGMEQMAKTIGICRVVLQSEEDKTFDMDYYANNSGIDERLLKSLIHVGIDMGSDPKDWRVEFDTIEPDRFLSIEHYDLKKKEWQQISEPKHSL